MTARPRLRSAQRLATDNNLGSITTVSEQSRRIESKQSWRATLTIGEPAYSLLVTEACLQLLDIKHVKPSEQAIDKIVETCSNTSARNLTFSDLLAFSRRYAKGFKVLAHSKRHVSDLANALRSDIYKHLPEAPFGILLAKPTDEWLSICAESANRFILFDPHKRENVIGPYIFVATSIDNIVTEVQKLWSSSKRNSNAAEFIQTEVMNLLQIFVVARSPISLDHLPELPRVEDSGVNNTQVLKLIAARKELESKEQPKREKLLQQQREEEAISNNNETLEPAPSVGASDADDKMFQDRLRCPQCHQICYWELMFTLKRCEHKICLNCLRTMILQNISSGVSPTTCPWCLIEVSFLDVERALADEHPDELEDYVRLLQIHHLTVTANNESSCANCRLQGIRSDAATKLADDGESVAGSNSTTNRTNNNNSERHNFPRLSVLLRHLNQLA